jgi:hypothetical protein
MNRVISPSYSTITSEAKQLINLITSASGDRLATNSNYEVVDLSNLTIINNRNFYDGVIIKVKAGEDFGLALTNNRDLYYILFKSDSKIESFFLCSDVLDFWPFLNVFYLMVQTSNGQSFYFGKRNDFEQAVRRKRNYSEDLFDDGKRGHLQELLFMRMPNGTFKDFSCSDDHGAFLMKYRNATYVHTFGSNRFFKCGHSAPRLPNYFDVSNRIQNKIKSVACTPISTIILTKTSNTLSQLYVIGGESKYSIKKVDLIASAYKLFSSDTSDDLVAVSKTRGAILIPNRNFKRQDIVLRQKKVESILFMEHIIFGRGHDIVNLFTDISKEIMKQCSDVDIYEYPDEEDPKLKEKVVADVEEWNPKPQVVIEKVEENEATTDAADIYFDVSKFTPPPAPEIDPLDLSLREYSLARYEKRYEEACNVVERENKRRRLT